jgi:hypothetical protein
MPMSQPSFLPPHQRARLDCNLGASTTGQSGIFNNHLLVG